MAPSVCIVKNSNNRKDANTTNKFITVQKTNQRYVVETITMTTTTVTERRIVREATEDHLTIPPAAGLNDDEEDLVPPALPAKPATMQQSGINNDNVGENPEKPPPIPPKESSPTTQISGILKGGKLWKQDSISQVSFEEITIIT